MTTKTTKTAELRNTAVFHGEGATPAPQVQSDGRDTVAAKLAELQSRLIHLDDATRQDFERIIAEARVAL